MSLSEDWSSLRMLIENTKDINSYSLEELYGTNFDDIRAQQHRNQGKDKKKQGRIKRTS